MLNDMLAVLFSEIAPIVDKSPPQQGNWPAVRVAAAAAGASAAVGAQAVAETFFG
ncbi:hypothetical protein [Nocardia elegans]|uniref:hypothetical protein n=1 Tax=Nocardia elegans TaxID=300029 RepID=UPI000A8012BD|nr:hypothetical protein [Nocardia elegans]